MRPAVIGAGPVGLTCVEESLADGHGVVGHEKYRAFSGSWHPAAGGAHARVGMPGSLMGAPSSTHPPGFAGDLPIRAGVRGCLHGRAKELGVLGVGWFGWEAVGVGERRRGTTRASSSIWWGAGGEGTDAGRGGGGASASTGTGTGTGTGTRRVSGSGPAANSTRLGGTSELTDTLGPSSASDLSSSSGFAGASGLAHASEPTGPGHHNHLGHPDHFEHHDHSEFHDAVLVADGEPRRPRFPDGGLPAPGTGVRVLTSPAEYREPETFAVERVLVVGGGVSGAGIAADLTPYAGQGDPANLSLCTPSSIQAAHGDRFGSDSVRHRVRAVLPPAARERLSVEREFGVREFAAAARGPEGRVHQPWLPYRQRGSTATPSALPTPQTPPTPSTSPTPSTPPPTGSIA
ncbi:hypothetical protein ABZX85_37100 [Streptomyces sp. NPDC004539]|uniref:hypothetical protein n=1 Tax=Streptomyces sp. NPDC004539 TaxID=3154280 RepID=UPI0033B0F8F2